MTQRGGRPRQQDVEQRVLDAAALLLGRSGYGGLRMDDVAAQAAVAKTTLYRRWPSKRALVVDTVAALMGAMPPLTGPTVADDIAAVTRWYAERVGDPRTSAGLLGLYAEAAREPEVAATLRRLQEPYLAQVRARLEEVGAGGDPAEQAQDLLHLVTGTVLHLSVTTGVDEAGVARLAALIARGTSGAAASVDASSEAPRR